MNPYMLDGNTDLRASERALCFLPYFPATPWTQGKNP